VLLASGYIAGGAIAGIAIAFVQGAMGDLDATVTKWSNASNPFYSGPYADLLALLPFAALTAYLLHQGRRKVATK
jgi:hypothetical protein